MNEHTNFPMKLQPFLKFQFETIGMEQTEI